MTDYSSPEWARDHFTDDLAFHYYAEASFPWIRLVFGVKPQLPPHTRYVYVLRANGKTAKMKADSVAWYIAGRNYPRRTRPIAYIIVNADFNPNEETRRPS